MQGRLFWHCSNGRCRLGMRTLILSAQGKEVMIWIAERMISMNVFESVKAAVTTRQAAEHYGIEINHSGMARCPFHDDHTPSMKIDTRYHCFGCGADGDVINFTAGLFGLSNLDAAKMLAADFGINADHRGPVPMGFVRKTPDDLETRKHEWLLHAADVLTEYEKLLKDWREKYVPICPSDDPRPLYVESLRQLDRIELLLDMALCSDKIEQRALYLNYQEEVKKIEDRISDYKERTAAVPRTEECLRRTAADEEKYRPAV